MRLTRVVGGVSSPSSKPGSDRAAFDTHGMTAPTRRFRERLAPMNGVLPDERVYAALD